MKRLSMTSSRWLSLLAAIAAVGIGYGTLSPKAAQAQTPILVESGRLSETDTLRADNNAPYDLHSFSGLAGQTVVITLESYTFNTHLFVLDQAGNPIYQNDDAVAGETTNSLLRVVLPRDGEYHVAVNSADGAGRGTYLLVVADVTPTAPSASTASASPGTAIASAPQPLGIRAPVTGAQSPGSQNAGSQSSGSQDTNSICDAAVSQLTTTVTDGRRIRFPLQNVGTFAGQAPPGRSTVFTFGMDGPDVKYVLESPEFLTILTKIFLENCPSAGAIIVGNTTSGSGIALGLINNQVTRFQCAESLGISAGSRPGTAVPWGYYYCGG